MVVDIDALAVIILRWKYKTGTLEIGLVFGDHNQVVAFIASFVALTCCSSDM